MPHQKEGNKRLWEIGELDWNQFGRSVDLMGKKPMWERERERERESLFNGYGKNPLEMKRWGRWRDVSERERESVRENELDKRKDVVDLWVSNKSNVTIFEGG